MLLVGFEYWMQSYIPLPGPLGGGGVDEIDWV